MWPFLGGLRALLGCGGSWGCEGLAGCWAFAARMKRGCGGTEGSKEPARGMPLECAEWLPVH